MKPKIAQKSPFIVKEDPGRRFWCACGFSVNQPYCDGSHKGTGIIPIPVKFTETKTVKWCGCKLSTNKPYCDGTHSRL